MAEAVLGVFPDAKLAIGPPIADGFYYDFDLPRSLTPDDFPEIERRMQERITAQSPFVKRIVSRAEARAFFKDQPYKIELINDLPEGEEVSFYQDGPFTDLCAGPHVEHTGQIGPVKLMRVAGAYWRGDEHRQQLQRIYATAWESQADLDAYLHQLAEAERRDHRRLGRELDLFSTSDEIGAGLILWHPKGAIIRNEIENFWKQVHFDRGYDLLYTPHIHNGAIFERSGHLQTYAENMYSPMDIDGTDYYVKPMNCPAAITIYNTRTRSYRDLPLRWAELGTVYRYERSGVLHGMLRVRGFTQDDSHIFCTPEQLEDEVNRVIDLVDDMMQTFGYTYSAYLATRPEKWVGTEEAWEHATEMLRRALAKRGMAYEVDEGGGTFYAPKIDIKLYDAIGREWQGPTIQVDMQLPDRFDMSYIGDDGERHRPVMVHRTVLGSMERFVGGLIEHYAGAFPVWLAPVQAMVIPIADRHQEYAQEVVAALKKHNIRAEANVSDGRMQAKIRDAQVQKVPYMLVVGDREAEAGAVSVRLRSGEDLKSMPLAQFTEIVTTQRDSRSTDLLPEAMRVVAAD
ncbi:MAG: threonine--tRNA ligase [Chloroflexota bacterium]|nr:threonine--tRNA ligase [Chloroflexota bacterium]